MSENPEIEIGVFAFGSRTNSLPAYRTSREGALEMIRQGVARWVNNRRKNIIMTVLKARVKIRDASCQMGPAIVEQAVDGSRYHQVLVEAWA